MNNYTLNKKESIENQSVRAYFISESGAIHI